MNIGGGIFEGAQKSDEKSDSILEMERRFRSGGIEELEIIYKNLYPNSCGKVNQIEQCFGGDIRKISQIVPNFIYVDGIPTLENIQISLKAAVKSRKFQI